MNWLQEKLGITRLLTQIAALRLEVVELRKMIAEMRGLVGLHPTEVREEPVGQNRRKDPHGL